MNDPSNPVRCPWASSGLSVRYHDEEWGVPTHDDRTLFEFLILEGAQAGLSWSTILNKRENYRKAFDAFDVERVARYDRRKVERLLSDPGIVRNKLKIASTIANAKAFLRVQKEFGSELAQVHETGSRAERRIRRNEQGSEEARLQLRRIDHLLRLHAGRWNGQRPRCGVLPLSFIALMNTSHRTFRKVIKR
jgi:DNA-3-methyladenine glycosylase I